ncbi:hypothetical protein U1700_11545 [Sphingomonas sp. RB1R13]
MLNSEEIERIERYSVESQRHRYSDAELWAWLIELNERDNEVVQLLPTAYNRASKSCAYGKVWNRLIVELNANQPMKDLIVWHLQRRGDETVTDWLSQNEERQRALAAAAQRKAWRFDND